ncbi:hypothetical protein Ancab_024019 [Ancistrocladus abbreviatus]
MPSPQLSKFSSISLLRFKPKSLNQLKEIHAQLITTSLQTTTFLAKLIQHYTRLSPISTSNYAYLLVNHYVDVENPFLLNVLIKCSQPRDSILLFAQWVSKSKVVFDDHTCIFVLGACARSLSVSALYEGKQIHARAMKDGLMSDLQVATTAIHFYACQGHLGLARKMFDEMPMRSAASWNALMTGYCSHNGNPEENACEALKLIKDILLDVSGVKPTDTTMICALTAASHLGELEIGKCVHGYIEKTVYTPENDVFIGTCLVDMYSKCGYLDAALAVFCKMEEKNVHTWTAMATGFAIHGRGEEALELLVKMRSYNIMPNVVTFTSLFTACCHGGLVKEGLHLFHNMKGFGVKSHIKHYGGIVDLLGRAGHLKEAYDIIMGMPLKPDPILWRSLLSSCLLHGDVEMGEKVGKVLLQPQKGSSCFDEKAPSEDYIALSNAYALAGRWEDVEMVREDMRIKAKPGCSTVKSISSHALDAL